MVMGTITRLVELKEHPGSSTWFKDYMAVFSDQAALGNRNIVVSQADEDNFSAKVYRPYFQSVIDNITLVEIIRCFFCLCNIQFTPLTKN